MTAVEQGEALTAAEVPTRLSMRYGEPGRGYVQVPVEMLKGEKAETVLIVSMLARRLRSSSAGVVENVLQAHLAYELGWIERDCDASPVVANRVSSWIRGASDTKWLDVQYSYDTRRQRTMARYRLWGRPSAENAAKYVVAPVELFDMVRDGLIDKHGFLAWLRWSAVIGTASSTTRSVPEWAERWGVSAATARRHRSALLKAGLLTEVASEGEASITALAPALTTSEGGDGAGSTPIKNHEPPRSKTVSHPCQESGPLVPTGVPKGISLPTSAAADVQEVTREPATTAAPSQKPDSSGVTSRRRQASASALGAAGRLLPRFRRDLVGCEAHFRRGLIRRAALFLDAGYGPEAVVRAANELTVDVIDGNHNDAFRTALSTLAVDVRLGACRGCGRDVDDFGHHSRCDQAPPSWLDEVTASQTCVGCGGVDGSRRAELPIPVVVCDNCWADDQELGEMPDDTALAGPHGPGADAVQVEAVSSPEAPAPELVPGESNRPAATVRGQRGLQETWRSRRQWSRPVTVSTGEPRFGRDLLGGGSRARIRRRRTCLRAPPAT